MHTSDFCFKNILQDIANGIGVKQKKSQIISFSYIFGLSGLGCELRVRDKSCLQYRPYLKFLTQNEPIIPNNPSNPLCDRLKPITNTPVVMPLFGDHG